MRPFWKKSTAPHRYCNPRGKLSRNDSPFGALGKGPRATVSGRGGCSRIQVKRGLP